MIWRSGVVTSYRAAAAPEPVWLDGFCCVDPFDPGFVDRLVRDCSASPY
jgi:hypothetical protein